MSFDFKGNTPIYLQIIDYIKKQIISKKYRLGEKLPSVRDFSMQFEVNPNTVQKALFELENMGIIITESTNGKFVTTDEAVIEKVKKETIEKMVEDLYLSFLDLGIKKEEVIEILSSKE